MFFKKSKKKIAFKKLEENNQELYFISSVSFRLFSGFSLKNGQQLAAFLSGDAHF